MEIRPPTKIILKQSPTHGLGVFSSQKIFKGNFINIQRVVNKYSGLVNKYS
jgi:SET domain-containing protein